MEQTAGPGQTEMVDSWRVEEPATAAATPTAVAGSLVNAAVEGSDIASNNVPLSYSELYDRIDRALRASGKKALCAVGGHRTNPMHPIEFRVYLVELKREIDLVQLGRELDLIEPWESPLPLWPTQPRG